MNIIGVNDVVEANALLRENGLPYKVHLRDACGKQSCWLERLANNNGNAADGNGSVDDALTRTHELLTSFFAARRVSLEFDEQGMAFWVG